MPKPSFDLPDFPLSIGTLADVVKLPDQVKELVDLFASGKQFKDDLPTSILSPLQLSGTSSLSDQQGSVSYLVNGSAEAKFQVSAFNDPADVDPDKIVSHAKGKAWLKHEIGAALKGNVKGSLTAGGTPLEFGLEAGLGARLIQYRSHAPTEGVGPAVVSDLATFRFAVRREDIEALGPDDSLALLLGARLAFNAKLTWADAFTATIAALDQALGVAEVSALSIEAGASLAFNIAVNDDYRLVFRGTGSPSTIVEVRKVHASKVGLTASLEVKAQLANPDGLRQALDAYLVARLGAPIEKIQALEEKIDSALTLEQVPDEFRPLAIQIANRLGLADLQARFGELKARFASLKEQRSQKLQAALETRVQLSFQLAYTRVSNEEAVLVCELDRAALAKHHRQLLLGNLTGVLTALAEGENGYKLVEYLKTKTIETKFSFGFSLSIGKWAGSDITVKDQRWEIQTNLANHERVSFDGRKTNPRKWGDFEVQNSIDFSASMNAFSAAATANASEFQYGLSMAWQWNTKLTPALLDEAFDLANLWGAFDESRNEDLAAEIRAKLSGKVQIDVQLDLADSAFRFFFDLPDAQAGAHLEAAWTDALAVSLPRVVVAKDAFRSGVGQRRAVYGAAAQFVLSQAGSFDITAAIGRVRYEAAGLSGHDLTVLKQIDLGTFVAKADAFPQSLLALWTQDTSGSRPLGRLQRASQAIFRFEKSVHAGGDRQVIRETFDQVADLLSMPYYYRVLGAVFAALARRGGQKDHATSSLRITDSAGNVVLVG